MIAVGRSSATRDASNTSVQPCFDILSLPANKSADEYGLWQAAFALHSADRTGRDLKHTGKFSNTEQRTLFLQATCFFALLIAHHGSPWNTLVGVGLLV